jgi:hypothetical protein
MQAFEGKTSLDSQRSGHARFRERAKWQRIGALYALDSRAKCSCYVLMRKPGGTNIRGVYRGRSVDAFVRLGKTIADKLKPDIPPADEDWWNEVLFDRRARWPREDRIPADDPHSYLRLDRFKNETMILKCDKCKVRREYRRDQLISGYGGNFNRAVLRFKLQPCPSRHSDAIFNTCRLEFE